MHHSIRDPDSIRDSDSIRDAVGQHGELTQPRSFKRMVIGLVAAGAVATLVLSPLLEVVAATTERSVFTGSRMPYNAFDQLPQTHLQVGGADLSVGFAPGDMQLDEERVRKWIQQRADIVARYFGRFPVESARILIIPVRGPGVQSGSAFGWRGAALKLYVGEAVTEEELAKDWMLAHEMVHFAHPSLHEDHGWLSEGLASYVEPVARAQAGDITEAAVWWEFGTQMAQGLPRAGDRGLDYTHTWGRTYWGGALFCLYADVQIRKRTDNRYGLQDAMSALVAAGGVITKGWSIREALRVGDQATNTHVLEELYDELRAQPGNIDLEQLWRDLGVRIGSSTVTFDERAPLAAVRRAITRSKPVATSL